jgi:type IV secretory pathway TraG/TraD family ATPase VirD4
MLDPAPIGTHADHFFGEPDFSVPADARRKHMALFGGTGTGKSTLLANMAAADLAAGTGITVVDPHGGLCEELLTNHIPRHRKNDVIFFDPKSRTHALALNVLDCPRPEQRGLVVSHVVSIFHTLWAESWGPRLEDILRNALWVLIEQPTPTSLLALPKLLTEDTYRSELLRHVENPAVLDFFSNTFARWTSSFRDEAVSPVLNKARAFLTDPLMRAVIGQTRSSFNFRWMMDHRKILLCDLAKGSIGDDNSRLLGSLIVLKTKLAGLSRQDIRESDRIPHVLYCEEAHNFVGDFESILAEARKFKLLLVLATQGTESLSREAAFAIFSNCATVISFRVSGSDAVRIRDEFGVMLPASSLQDLPDYTMYVRTLSRTGDAGASPSGPHFVSGHPPFDRHPRYAHRESVIRVSQARYARARAEVDEEMRRDFFDGQIAA